MDQQQVALLQANWKAATTNAPDLADKFYGKLFEIAPQVKPMFKGDMKAQGAKLAQTLDVLVTNLDDISKVVDPVVQLGKRHSENYGVKDEHYGPVGEALIWALKEATADTWTDEVQNAWLAVYGVVVAKMTGK